MKEQIKEIENTLITISEKPVMIMGLEHWADVIAEELYNAGYRKQEWISVEDRLPEKHKEVLVVCLGNVGTDFIATNGRWYEHDHWFVTHWMPLPEPPKMKGGAE